MRYYSLIFALLIGVTVSISNPHSAHALFDNAKVTLVVVDEDGKPLEGVDAGVGFEKNTNWATKTKAHNGLTGANGKFTASGSCNGHISYGGRKEGYYDSYYSYDFKEAGVFGWSPWNPELKIVMRKIENPVPMYARKVRLVFPIDNKDIGFDLVKFDWITPFGNGVYADIIFNVNVIDNGGDDFEYNLGIKFPNKFDGMIEYEEDMHQGSVFKLPRFAPTEGYKSEHKAFLIGIKRGAKMSFKQSHHYILRVRSEEERGKLKRAMYGKILTDIAIISAKKTGGMPSLEFMYYLNPDYTRNLEFDPKRNLFKNISDLERLDNP